jgi:uncharacterized membrane protein
MTSNAPPPNVPPAVERVERLIGILLRTGVLLSLAAVVLGIILTFLHHPSYLSNAQDLPALVAPATGQPHSLPAIASGILAAQGPAIIMAGLLLLIATPVLRVAVSILAFFFQKDYLFTLITTVVLALLLLSFLLGHAGG